MSNKTVLLSVDNNLKYLYLLPIVAKSWNIQGWTCCIYLNNITDKQYEFIREELNKVGIDYITISSTKTSSTINPALYTQCERMYMPQCIQDKSTYCIMSDVDMFIASDFLNRDYDKVNSFGYDLTGYTQIPMCYVGMTVDKWDQLMGTYDVEVDLATYAKKDSQDFYQAWGCDQDILTGRMRGIVGYHNVNFIERGKDHDNSGLPMGRLDRYNWVYPKGQIHDCHLPHDAIDKVEKIEEMCKFIYPNENWNWIQPYTEEFKKLIHE